MAKRGRPAIEPVQVETVQVAEEVVQADLAAADRLAVGTAMVLGYEQVLRQVGQLEALEFTKRVSSLALVQIFQSAKESKAYIGLPYKTPTGETKYVSSLEEFCEFKLGRTARRVQQLVQNFHLLGPELYEASETLGLRNVDYRALRALPADEQALVKQAIEGESSREEVLALLEELAARHVSERTALAKERDEARADLDAARDLSRRARERADEAEHRLARISLGSVPVAELVAPIVADTHAHGRACEEQLIALDTLVGALDVCVLREFDKPLDEQDRRNVLTAIQHMRDQLWRLANNLANIQADFDGRLGLHLGGRENDLLRTDDDDAAGA